MLKIMCNLYDHKFKKYSEILLNVSAEGENRCNEESIVESHDERQVVVAQP